MAMFIMLNCDVLMCCRTTFNQVLESTKDFDPNQFAQDLDQNLDITHFLISSF
jgi:hypothetical protein